MSAVIQNVYVILLIPLTLYVLTIGFGGNVRRTRYVFPVDIALFVIAEVLCSKVGLIGGTISFLMCMFITACVTFACNWKKQIVYVLWTLTFINLIYMLSYCLVRYFIHNEWMHELYQRMIALVLMTAIIVRIMWYWKNKKQVHLERISVKKLLLLLGDFMIIEFAILYLMLYIPNQTVTRIQVVLIIIGSLVLVGIVVGLEKQSEKLIEEQQLYEQTIQLQEQNYLCIEANNIMTKSVRHDLKGHLNALQSMLRQKQYVDCELYLSDINGALNREQDVFQLNNSFMNCIVNEFEASCRTQGIVFEVLGAFPSNMNVSKFDLTTIFHNLLQNAMEATATQTEKKIFFSVRYDEMFLYVQEKNTCQKKSGIWKTRKSTDGWHGIGLKNMKETIEKYGGIMDIEQDEQMTTILFKIKYQ